MANGKWLKWFVGLSSVAMFTGFVGLSQQYDEKSVTVATNDSNDQGLTNNENSENVFPDFGTSFDDLSSIEGPNSFQAPQTDHEQSQYRDFGQDHSFSGNTDQGRIRSRAS